MVIGRKEAGVLAAEFHNPFQVGTEGGKIRGCPGARPGFLRQGGYLGKFCHVFGGNAGVLFVILVQHANQAGIIRVGIHRSHNGLAILNQLTHLRAGEHAVGQAAQYRQLVAAVFRPAGRHVGLLIPTQHGSCTSQVGNLSNFFFQLIQFFHLSCLSNQEGSAA